jgi:glycogen operon protein
MDHGLVAFTARLAALRRAHPALVADLPLTGAPRDATGIPDVEWRRPDGGALATRDWETAEAGGLVAILYAAGDRVAVALHRGEQRPVPLRLPAPRAGFAWRLLLDSADPDRAEAWVAGALEQPPRSVLLLAEAPAPPR